MANDGVESKRGIWKRTIGIVGGLGPHAHLHFERRLLAAVGDARTDQDYPPWILSSLPATPDRTLALGGRGPSPTACLAESVRRIEESADFAVIVCNTAHAFLDEVRREAAIPILDMVRETLLAVVMRFGPGSRAGLLATTGTVGHRIYHEAASRWTPGLEVVPNWTSFLLSSRGLKR